MGSITDLQVDDECLTFGVKGIYKMYPGAENTMQDSGGKKNRRLYLNWTFLITI